RIVLRRISRLEFERINPYWPFKVKPSMSSIDAAKFPVNSCELNWFFPPSVATATGLGMSLAVAQLPVVKRTGARGDICKAQYKGPVPLLRSFPVPLY